MPTQTSSSKQQLQAGKDDTLRCVQTLNASNNHSYQQDQRGNP
ncbi:hypothetical protein SynMITS9220_01283 [Synechococcus sp. MIT S9220]|nr:hypothetical protein SynMITS9220_01283 [Synechococcus sp. MIT S9220]